MGYPRGLSFYSGSQDNYAGKFYVSKDWTNIEIKFDDFTKSNFYQPQKFNSSEIKSIAFVAFGKDFNAQLDIIEAELF